MRAGIHFYDKARINRVFSVTVTVRPNLCEGRLLGVISHKDFGPVPT